MKLDRNTEGRGKYAVVKLREIDETSGDAWPAMLEKLSSGGFVSFGKPGDRDEFFVLMLKDKYAQAALAAYADAAEADDPEYAAEVRELMRRAGPSHPNVKRPD